MDLSGKSIIVTGSGGGLGQAIATELARRGALLTIADVDQRAAEGTASAISGSGGRAIAVAADVSRRDQVASMVQAAAGAFGKLDVIVNNAGRGGQADFLTMSDDEWDRVLETNLRGVFLCSQEAARQMVAQGTGGTIINVTSALGEKGSTSAVHYAASKGGVNALTRSLAAQLAQYRIEVVAAGPGPTDTAMLRGMYPPEVIEERRRAGILVEVDPFVQMVAFLASDASNGWSGQVIARGVYQPS